MMPHKFNYSLGILMGFRKVIESCWKHFLRKDKIISFSEHPKFSKSVQ